MIDALLLLYEVSIGDMGLVTLTDVSPMRLTIAVVVVTGVVKMSPTAAPANSRGEGSGTEQDQQQLSGCCWCCCYLPTTSFTQLRIRRLS